MQNKNFRIGWLVDLNWISENKKKADHLIDYLHIDTLWLESGHYHTAGYCLSDELWHQSPFVNWNSQTGLKRHLHVRKLPDRAYPVLPGVLGGADDLALLEMMAYAKAKTLKLWGHMGLWSYGGMVYPDFSVTDIFGNAIDETQDIWGACFCPNNPIVNQWIQACLDEICMKYALDGIQIDHGRYPPPNSIPNLWGCACRHCTDAAKDLGLNLNLIGQDLVKSFEEIVAIPSESLLNHIKEAETLRELIIGVMPELMDWFNIRAHLLSRNVNQFAKNIKSKVGSDFEIGIDVFPPSIALFGGHLYDQLDQLSFITGGFGFIGWEQVAINTIKSWVQAISSIYQDIDQKQLLQNFHRLLFRPIVNKTENEGLTLENLDRSQVLIHEIQLFSRSDQQKDYSIFPPLNLSNINIHKISGVLASMKDNHIDGVILANFESIAGDDLFAVKHAIERYL